MKLYKKLSVVFLIYGFSAVVIADPLTVYGKANVSVQSSDEGEGRFTDLKSNASRVGVKGDFELDTALELLYLVEWQVDLADESGSDNITSRNQYIGLKGEFGTVLLGRNDTVLKQSQGNIDQFGDYQADIKGLWKGENRMGESLTYFSPKYRGFILGVSYVAEGHIDGNDAQSVSISYGDKNLKESQWFASVAADFSVLGYDAQRLSVQTKLDNLVLGAIFQNQESTVTGDSKNGAMVSAAYHLNKVVFKGQLQTMQDDSSFSVGLDYKLAKATKLFGWYSTRNLDESDDKSWLAVGIEHQF